MSVASTTSAPTPVVVEVAASPVLKPVPSSIFLPLRLSLFLFSFVTSSALIDFRMFVNELISLALASTSVWEVAALNKPSADASLLDASFRIVCCLVLFLILSIWIFNSSIFCANTDLSTSFWVFSPACALALISAFSEVCVLNFLATASATFSLVFWALVSKGLTSAGVEIVAGVSFTSPTLLSLFCWAILSLASTTPAPKNKPTPIRTLAVPTLNFLIEYVSIFSAFCSNLFLRLFFPTINFLLYKFSLFKNVHT